MEIPEGLLLTCSSRRRSDFMLSRICTHIKMIFYFVKITNPAKIRTRCHVNNKKIYADLMPLVQHCKNGASHKMDNKDSLWTICLMHNLCTFLSYPIGFILWHIYKALLFIITKKLFALCFI